MAMSALVHFLGENKTDILNIEEVKEEARFKGAICQVNWKGFHKPSTAKVLMISDNMDELEMAEDAFHNEIDTAQKNPPAKRQRKQNRKYGSEVAASDKDVSLALQERPKLRTDQKQKKDAATKKGKATARSSRAAQSQLDKSVLENITPVIAANPLKTAEEVKRALHFNPQAITDNVPSDVDDPVEDIGQKEDSPLLECNNNDVDAKSNACIEEINEKISSSPSNICICRELKNLVNPGMKAFWSKIGEVMGMGVTHSNCTCNVNQQQLEYIEVLPDRPGEQMVELTKGFGVQISLRKKNQIKVDFSSKPTQMVTALLEALFSKSAFRSTYVTARGNISGSKGIRQEVLSAMLGFINRHVERKMLEAEFIRCVNRRANTWREGSHEGHTVSLLKRASASTTSLSKQQCSESASGTASTKSASGAATSCLNKYKNPRMTWRTPQNVSKMSPWKLPLSSSPHRIQTPRKITPAKSTTEVVNHVPAASQPSTQCSSQSIPPATPQPHYAQNYPANMYQQFPNPHYQHPDQNYNSNQYPSTLPPSQYNQYPSYPPPHSYPPHSYPPHSYPPHSYPPHSYPQYSYPPQSNPPQSNPPQSNPPQSNSQQYEDLADVNPSS